MGARSNTIVAAQIHDAGAFGRSLVQSATLDAAFDAANAFTPGCLLSDDGNSITITATASDESAVKFYNSASSGVGGRVFEIGSTIAGTTGTLPFVFGAVEFDVNDDSSRDFNVFFGHGFSSNGGLQAGAAWGASGFVFEQHYNPSAGVNQSESYARLWSLQGGGTEYRPIGWTHSRHEMTDGTDSIQVNSSCDTFTIQDKTSSSTRFTVSSANFTVASGLTISFSGGATTFNATTGQMVTSAVSTQFAPTLTTDGDTCVYMQPTINLGTAKTARGAYLVPQWTSGGTSSAFVGYGIFSLSSKALSTSVGYQADIGVNGSVTVGTATHFRTNPQAYTGTVTTMIGFHAQAITATGTVTNGYGVKIENHTGHYAFHSGTGKHLFGSASANTLVGFYGATPVAQQTGVAVSAAGIHAALVNLGLITA